MVVHDVDDQVVPYHEGLCYARMVKDAHLLSTEGLGHYRILKADEVVSKAIAFLGAPGPRREQSQRRLEPSMRPRARGARANDPACSPRQREHARPEPPFATRQESTTR